MAKPPNWQRGTRTNPACWQPKLPPRCRSRASSSCRSCSGVAEEIITRSADETMEWGRAFARRLQPPVLVLLTGDLGSGKTTLTKGMVAGLGAASEDDVTSPTF